MNERIQELAEQAGLKVNADGEIGPAFFGSVDAGYKKFAELIVRECMGIAEENQPRDVDWNVSDIIRVHFGVQK